MALLLTLCLVILGTSFLSGIFGMAGGLILVGVLLERDHITLKRILHV